MKRFGLFLMALLWLTPAWAADKTLELKLPIDINMHVNGTGHDVALWVADDRQDTSMGKDLDGDYLMIHQDPATELMSAFAMALSKAGFRVVPYSDNAPMSLLINIRSIDYSGEKTFFTSTSHIHAALKATVSSNGNKLIGKTIELTHDYKVPLTPRVQKLGEFVSETLGDVTRSVLTDKDIANALLGRQ